MSTAPRGNHFDREYLSKEPPITPTSTTTDYVRAYNWYNYSYTSEDAKTFTLAYLKKIKYDPDAIKALSGVEHWRFGNIGWNTYSLWRGRSTALIRLPRLILIPQLWHEKDRLLFCRYM